MGSKQVIDRTCGAGYGYKWKSLNSITAVVVFAGTGRPMRSANQKSLLRL